MIGVGIIGAGFFGAVHAQAIGAVPDVRVAAVCRQDIDAARAFARQHGGNAHGHWQAVLDDPAVDAVVIATPHQFHAEMAIAAAGAGKHILLEKPMAPTVAECDAINTAVARAGVRLMVGHLMHFALPCLVGREILERGDIGRPVLGSSSMIKLWMEANRRPWHLSSKTGGGMLLTAGIHALDRLVWLMGGEVEGVSALAGTFFHDQEADDTALMLLRFADGRAGQVSSVGYRDGGVGFALDLVCEAGTMRLDFDRGVSVGRGGAWTPVPNSLDPDWMLRAVEREWQAMAAAIRGDAPVAVDGAYGRHIIACIEAAMSAGRLRREVALAPPPA
ncbi:MULTISPECIES: Gfo/Idh/MocA family protein [Inquilinus]|uniref:Dehydrogenase n=1 Tax=Inquilinus ginsengisoli TaxID=363840 RepID=A0ABU1JQ29_9PROT|nr:Gfo/Idh/MocA family oxidoreductase [Inquilinus ginsengisoli]MDR6290717.1 putative dehydrogenase [Inquilinus ginsengisoli]